MASFLEQTDSTVLELIEKESRRQQMTLNMIAAENTAPPSILEAVGSAFNNKTAEGYPGRRYHTGCEVTDELEMAIQATAAIIAAAASLMSECFIIVLLIRPTPASLTVDVELILLMTFSTSSLSEPIVSDNSFNCFSKLSCEIIVPTFPT